MFTEAWACLQIAALRDLPEGDGRCVFMGAVSLRAVFNPFLPSVLLDPSQTPHIWAIWRSTGNPAGYQIWCAVGGDKITGEPSMIAPGDRMQGETGHERTAGETIGSSSH